ncbi:MAG: isoleucine--tRNA ligase [Campylobacter sp.]|uniref:isoleucine--tRNA ligase n=1 Tax=Campylobacter sp. TaxID=205 RepID=UPI002AA887A1|nr:isoleucine--tRNA ligase [Campylobacter sp.]MCI6344415.1 isoleucine--tRNA ligase [Campylobacter sp.]MCI6695797.1 isoleucine--tRNA ligase [Campylobacter sp.]
MDYKDTLLLPNTDFAMRANLPENEPKRFAKWQKEGAYAKMKANRKNASASFCLHDGPPYANGHIHIGHALNKILKDIIVKTHYFSGESVRYTPGWDCHGLPIEQQVENKLGEKKKTASKAEIREHCRAWASEFINIQRDEFKALGVIADWDEPYLTMKYAFEADIYKALCAVAKKGLLIERSKPVFWSWAARSALAEAEVEYEEKEDYSIFVAFGLSPEAEQKIGAKGARAVIWTTTPWTLVANQGISLNPNETYALTAENLIFAKPLIESVVAQGLSKGEIIKEFKSTELEGLYAINPLNGRKSLFMLGEHVLMDGGSGLVHTAPGHGEDDYFVSLKYNVEVIMPVDEGGCYDETLRLKELLAKDLLDEFIGMHIFKANDRIVELLGEFALKVSKFTHSYPFCWRTHKPVIYRATKQWFISMDSPKLSGGRSLRQVALSELENVEFIPAAGIKRISSMIENRPDWCISRQRDWGVPIAFFRHKGSKEPIFDEGVLGHIARIFEQKGCDAWWELEISELLPKNSKYKADELEKVYDILDVWFDSGSTWNAVLKSGNYDAGGFRADMYLEGSDQHRGWFQSSLLLSCAINECAPFKSVLTHGFTVDGKGEKMSKSKGNVVSPDAVAKEFGVEILRMWVALSDYTDDLKISPDILKQTAEQYRKIRNTIRFLLANTNDLKEIKTDNFTFIDKWILSRASEAFSAVTKCFKSYDFSKGFNILLGFLSGDLSGIYLDICKDRLYCDSKNSARRISAQSAMSLIAKALLSLVAPTLTYTVDEALNSAPSAIKGDWSDVFSISEFKLDFDFGIDASFLLASRELFNENIDKLKKDKIIKSTLELELVTDSRRILALCDEFGDDISDFYGVSAVVAKESNEVLCKFACDEANFSTQKASAFKCPRCWKLNASKTDALCPRCQAVMESK